MPSPARRTADERNYLTFRIGTQSYALAADAVAEVIRPPSVARVPHGPPGLLGLASLRGAVLPIASLRGLLGAPPLAACDTSRVLVLVGQAPIGLAVDAVDALVSVDAGAVEADQVMMSAQPGERLTGAFRVGKDAPLTKVIDLEALLRGAFPPRTKRLQKAELSLSAHSDAETRDAETPRLVVFEVAGQVYALYLSAVHEVLNLPKVVVREPRAEALVLGVADHRGGLLSLFSLRGLLGLVPAGDDQVDQRVIVTKAGGVTVGLVVDRMRAIVPAAPELIEAVPRVLAARTGGEAQIVAILRDEKGGGLVSILSPDAIFREEIMQRLGHALDQETPAAPAQEDLSGTLCFLVFRLGEDEFALPIEVVDEVAPAPAQITRVPKAPTFLEGVINLRGDVLPVIDQRRRFDMDPAPDGVQRRLVVVRTEKHRAGILVDGVSEVLRSSADQIEAAPDLTGHAGKLVNGVLNLNGGGRILLVLDPHELLTRVEIALLEGFEAETRQAEQ